MERPILPLLARMPAAVIRDRHAATLVEYAIIAAIIVATVAIGFVSLSGALPF